MNMDEFTKWMKQHSNKFFISPEEILRVLETSTEKWGIAIKLLVKTYSNSNRSLSYDYLKDKITRIKKMDDPGHILDEMKYQEYLRLVTQ